jgi:ornithine cyclodeaminase
MLILDSDQVRQALPMPAAVEAMKQALQAISDGQVTMPHRTHLNFPDRNGTTLVMPAHVGTGSIDSLAVKVVSVFGDNPGRDLPRIMAAVMVFDPETGQPLALLEGTTLTQIRTAAASGAATDLLARPDCQTLAVIGAGVQARSHIEAMTCVRAIKRIHLASRTRESCQRLVEDLAGKLPEDCQVVIFDDASQAVAEADLVCTVSTSSAPLFGSSAIRPGTHINAVGSYQPHVVEIPADVIARARVFVDHLASALEEAGDLLQPIQAGLIGADHVRGEVGEVIAGRLQGRTDAAQITLFKSVGNAVEDCLAAGAAIRGARKMKLGHEIRW